MKRSHEPDDEAIDAMLRAVPPDADEPTPDPSRIVAWHQRLLQSEDADETTDDHEGAALARSAYARDLLAGLVEPLPPALTTWAEAAIPRRRRRRLWIAAPLALAAAVLLAVLLGAPAEGPGAYRLARIEGQTAAVRGEETGEPPLFLSGGAVRLWVVPAADDARLARHAALFTLRDARLHPAAATVTALDGAFRIEAAASAVFAAPGEHTLYVVLATEPDALADAADRAPDAIDGVQVVPITARYREATP